MNNVLVYVAIGSVTLVAMLVFWWFYRANTLIEIFLKAAREVLADTGPKKIRFMPVYKREELAASYKGREITIGINYSGLKGEFLPLPYICMRLKETIGYNLNRLPNYAFIEKNMLIYNVKISVLYGVFDKNFPQIFSKNYLVIALEKLLATAEDVERGRQIREVFR